MIGPERLLPDRQGALDERPGLARSRPAARRARRSGSGRSRDRDARGPAPAPGCAARARTSCAPGRTRRGPGRAGRDGPASGSCESGSARACAPGSGAPARGSRARRRVAQVELDPAQPVQRGRDLHGVRTEDVLPDPESPARRADARLPGCLLAGRPWPGPRSCRRRPRAGAERGFLDPEGPLEHLPPLGVVSAPLEEAAEEVEGLGDLEVAGTQRALPESHGLARLGDPVLVPPFLEVALGLGLEVPRPSKRLVRRRRRGQREATGRGEVPPGDTRARRPGRSRRPVSASPAPFATTGGAALSAFTASGWPGTRPRRTPGRRGRRARRDRTRGRGAGGASAHPGPARCPPSARAARRRRVLPGRRGPRA